MTNMKDSILKQLLIVEDDSYSLKYFLSFLGNNKEEFINILDSMDDSCLYDSFIHGKNHSERVLLFSFLLSKYYKLEKREQMILMDAAWHHDIGRIDDSYDYFHGERSAKLIDNVIDLNKYTADEINILKAIMTAHSNKDSIMMYIFLNYNINYTDKNINMYLKLAKILKDADALDRFRFSEYSMSMLDEKYLRYDYSKELMDFSNLINNLYRRYNFKYKSKNCLDRKK